MTGLDALYEDRGTGRTLPVTLSAAGDHLVIRRADGRELDRWPWRDVAPVPGDFIDSRPRFGLAADSNALLVIDDADALFALVPAATRVRSGHRARRDLPLPIWIGGALASVLLLVFVILPQLASLLAPQIPQSWQARIGDQVLVIATAMLTKKDGNAQCQAPDGKTALDRLAVLMPPTGTAPRLRVIESDLPNAFALPGGHIVLTSALIDMAPGPDAVLGVVGHELGHVVHGHAMERVMRYGLVSSLISLVVGDFGGGFLAVAVSQMAEAGFSQEQERQADAFAIDIMGQGNFTTQGMAVLFQRMLDKYPHADGVLARWMGSHPELSERIATLRAVNLPRDTNASLTDAQWHALRTICAKPTS